MLYLYLNHENEFEISNLIKVFFFREKIQIFKDKKVFDTKKNIEIKNIFIESIFENGVARSTVKGEEHEVRRSARVEDTNILEDNESKREKITIRKSLYEALSAFKSRNPGWGILTGVRPVKIYHTLREKGFDEKDVRDVLRREYKLNNEKIKLVTDIGNLEREIIYPLDENRYSLYIGIPFCPTRCSYCSFTSNKYMEKSAEKYVDYLEREMEEVSKILKARGRELNTVYIGGGTPTALNLSQLRRLFTKLRECFDTEYKEFTVEAGRPDTVDIEKLKLMKEFGVNRISINPQTMNDETLMTINRAHMSDDIIKKYNMAREIGFDSINMDIIVGLPDEGVEEIEHTMKMLSELKPENLTVHTMALKKISQISQNIGDYNLKDSLEIESMLRITQEYAEKMGLKPYYMYRQKQILGNFENVGYAAPGKECIYNIMMMEEKETIIALGVGSISKFFYPDEDRVERVPNFKDLNVYFDRIDEVVERKRSFIEDDGEK